MSLFRRKAFFWSIVAVASLLLLGYGGYRGLTDFETAEFEQWTRFIQKTITDGYYYNYRQTNGGGVTVGYDVTSGRAYCQTNPR